MEYKESIQKASELTRSIIQTLSKLEEPMNPVNYAIWYEYFLGSSSSLNADLDKVLNNEIEYNSDLAEQLFLRYIAVSDISKLEKVEQDVLRIVTDIMQLVKAAGIDVGHYNESLIASSSCLTNSDSVSEMKSVLGSIVEETQAMVAKNSSHGDKLESTTYEIQALKEELQKVREEASQDTLTGLANRKTFDTALSGALDTTLNKLEKVCLMMIDIDHFKNINDTHGHVIGDQVIKFIATILKQSVKGRDLVARYGGEEFAIVLQDTPHEGAMIVAKSIRGNIERSRLRQKGTGNIIEGVTVSIGVESAIEGDTPEDLICRSDKALYHSKRTGRNKVSSLGNEKNSDKVA